MTADPLEWLDSSLQSLKAQHLYREPTIRGGPQAGQIVVDGRQHLNFGSNDYLALANHPAILAAVQSALSTSGWGSGASPLVTGRTSHQAELERNVAAFEGTEAALVFPSGFAANAGTLSCLASGDDVIFSDAKNHASLIDGCRLSAAQVEIYPHGDMAALSRQLAADTGAHRRVIVTDGLFSMDGDFAPLPDLVDLARRHQAILVVDEAHATGVIGANGRGVCEHFGVKEEVPVRIGTFSKALGSIGGFVAGQTRLIDWLFNRARPFVFSTALPAACHVAARTAIGIVKNEPERRATVIERSALLRQSLAELGWQVDPGLSQIVPVRVGDPATTMQLAARLRQDSFWVPGIRPPSVGIGESMLRISVSYGHRDHDINRLIEVMAKLRDEFSVPPNRY